MKITAKTSTTFDITGISQNTAQCLAGLLEKGNFPEAANTGLFTLRNNLEDALYDEGLVPTELSVKVKRVNSEGSIARYIVSR